MVSWLTFLHLGFVAVGYVAFSIVHTSVVKRNEDVKRALCVFVKE